MYLPAEIHHLILQHLSNHDIKQYRLTCRNFSPHGLDRLFVNVSFTASLLNLKKLGDIASREYLGRHVRNVLWRSDYQEVDARGFFEGLRTREMRNLLHQVSHCSSQVEEISETKYHGKEKISGSLGVFLLRAVLSGFPNLRGIDIGMDEIHTRRDLSSFNNRYKMQTLLLAAYLAGCKTIDLMAHVAWEPIGLAEHFWPSYSDATESLSSLSLGVQFPRSQTQPSSSTYCSGDELLTMNASLPALKTWLSKAKNLKSMDLQFPSLWWNTTENPAVIGNAPLECFLSFSSIDIPSYSSLCNLSLGQLVTSSCFLLGFLSAHLATLRTLKLKDIVFSPQDSWVTVFPEIRARLRLKKARMSKHFSNGPTFFSAFWYVGDSLADDLENYLTRRSVICPVKWENRDI